MGQLGGERRAHPVPCKIGDNEKELIRELTGKRRADEIAAILKVSVSTVGRYRALLGLSRRRCRRPRPKAAPEPRPLPEPEPAKELPEMQAAKAAAVVRKMPDAPSALIAGVCGRRWREAVVWRR